MDPLRHLANPAYDHREGSGSKTHYEAADGQTSLCKQVRVFRVVDGETCRVWYPTKRPVTCKGCVGVLRVMVRAELAGLTGDQLDDIAAHIKTYRDRAKYGAPR